MMGRDPRTRLAAYTGLAFAVLVACAVYSLALLGRGLIGGAG
tara:strand:+ start:323 stop:448 length:126 start_codon:yes stop_codon:yes gene_type:complete